MPERADLQGMSGPETVLAFDFGLKRIGIASGDTLTARASARPAAVSGSRGPDWRAIEREVRALAPALLVVGAPYNADGSEARDDGERARFAADLERRFGLPVHLVDERFSSLEASAALRDAARQRPAPPPPGQGGHRQRGRRGDPQTLVCRRRRKT